VYESAECDECGPYEVVFEGQTTIEVKKEDKALRIDDCNFMCNTNTNQMLRYIDDDDILRMRPHIMSTLSICRHSDDAMMCLWKDHQADQYGKYYLEEVVSWDDNYSQYEEIPFNHPVDTGDPAKDGYVVMPLRSMYNPNPYLNPILRQVHHNPCRHPAHCAASIGDDNAS